MKYAGIIIPLGAVALAVFVFLGAGRGDYYLEGLGDSRPVMEELLKIRDGSVKTPEGQFTVNSRILSLYKETAQTDKLVLFSTNHAWNNPKDPYLGYYFFEVAESYRVQKDYPLAVVYYDRLLKNYPDLEYRGQSLHRRSLEWLVQIASEPRSRLSYLGQLTNRFSDQATLPRIQYYLGGVYEDMGEYEKAMEAYSVFLTYPGTIIPGEPQAWKLTREHVDFFRSSKSWVRPTLDSLIAGLQNAFASNDIYSIEALRSKRGFFVETWNNLDSRSKTEQDYREFVATQVRAGKIVVSSLIHPDSNEGEVYLKSTGWASSVAPIFYFALKKVHFPPDPEVNGSWEWAGLFMGEKL